jgi:hypothetical protein
VRTTLARLERTMGGQRCRQDRLHLGHPLS